MKRQYPENIKVSRKFKYIAENLPKEYEIKIVDYELCLVRKIGKFGDIEYEIEVSGLNTSYRKATCTIFAWAISPIVHEVFSVHDVPYYNVDKCYNNIVKTFKLGLVDFERGIKCPAQRISFYILDSAVGMDAINYV